MTKINLPNEVLEIFDVIKEYGSEAYVVGGCVRDSLLGRKINDWDICTPVPAAELKVFFEENGYRVIETGLKHGTITVMANGVGYEITTYRRDGDYSDGRHPDHVEFTSDLEEDLSRRDFTMNAIAYNPDAGFVDPFCGIEDINDLTIRCVGNPYNRFNEDGLRIMRAIRFSVQLGFELEEFTRKAAFELKENLKSISFERINSELCKILISNNPGELIFLYQDIFTQIVPEFISCIRFKQNNPYHKYPVDIHIAATLAADKSNDLIVRLALLFHDIGKPYCYQDDENSIRHFRGHGEMSFYMTDKIMKRLRFDNDTRNKVTELVKYHDATIEVGKKYVRRWLNILGEEQFRRLLLVRTADINGQSDLNRTERLNKIKEIENILEEVLSANECFSLKDLKINGNDLIKLDITEGKTIGLILSALLNMVINGEIENEYKILTDASLEIELN